MIERMVLFGASGDLASRLLMPPFAQLAEAGALKDMVQTISWKPWPWS